MMPMTKAGKSASTLAMQTADKPSSQTINIDKMDERMRLCKLNEFDLSVMLFYVIAGYFLQNRSSILYYGSSMNAK